jgi:hypothetical protein
MVGWLDSLPAPERGSRPMWMLRVAVHLNLLLHHPSGLGMNSGILSYIVLRIQISKVLQRIACGPFTGIGFFHFSDIISHLDSVVDLKLFFWIWIPFCSEFWIRIWIRILLDLQKVPDPIPDPTLNIHSYKIPTILKVFHVISKHPFQ